MTAVLEHDALIYSSGEQYLATIVPFLSEGVADGQGVVVATTDENTAALKGALGRAAEEVLFVPSSDVYRSPQAAVAAYQQVLDQFQAQGKPSVRAIGEVRYGDDPGSHDRWLRYESIAHTIFEDAPLHVICPYDARTLPERLIDHARRTHPHLSGDQGCDSSDRFTHPEVMLNAHPEIISFDVTRDPDVSVGASGRDVRPVRQMLTRTVAGRLPAARAEEAGIAIGELLANGVRHGKGRVTAAVWEYPDGLVCRIHNEGPAIEDPFAGYRPPRDPENGGMGLWIARQFADELAIDCDASGPSVTVAFFR